MKKSDKKIDNKLRLILTKVCERALDEVDGFQWLTHTLDYGKITETLLVTCVFDTNQALAKAKINNNTDSLTSLIHTELLKGGFKIRDINRLVKFDTEQNRKAK